MTFRSILYDAPAGGVETECSEPEFFTDLNLDQVVEAVTAGRPEYDLAPLFYAPLQSVEAIAYRHEVLRDLESTALLDLLGAFAAAMRAMREQLGQADKLHYRYPRESWFVDAVEGYCDAVCALAADLAQLPLKSRGFLGLSQYLADYIASTDFTALVAETSQVKDQLSAVAYCLQIEDSRIRVTRYEGEADYSAAVSDTFEKFREGAVRDYRGKFPAGSDMNHVEAGILDLVARLHPDVFAALDRYADRHRDYLDATVATFDREVQFYLAYLSFVERLGRAGLRFCYPQVCDQSKEVTATDTFDIALARKLVADGLPVVCNDVTLTGPERIIVVTGPNQGGKTTLARTFGQLHYLASMGLLVPGSTARLFLFDRMFTHFERGENLTDLSGKLQDDLVRIHAVLAQATDRSVIIMNEIFTSTTLQDAVFLGTEVLGRIIALNCLGVCVTFLDELASLSEAVVSMVSTVDPSNPAVRTYQLLRRPADGLAYANAIAKKYGLTYQQLATRIAS